MMLLTIITWWYTAGWAEALQQSTKRVSRVMQVFSVSLLAGSLFEPFRQISAGQGPVRGFDAQLRDLGDRLFSRLFGAVVRSLFICIGLAGALGAALIGCLQLVVWPLVPLLPVIGLVVMLTGRTL
jgi:hypothetical protein